MQVWLKNILYVLVLVWDHAAVERSENDLENLSDEHQMRSGEPQNARKQSVPTLLKIQTKQNGG